MRPPRKGGLDPSGQAHEVAFRRSRQRGHAGGDRREGGLRTSPRPSGFHSSRRERTARDVSRDESVVRADTPARRYETVRSRFGRGAQSHRGSSHPAGRSNPRPSRTNCGVSTSRAQSAPSSLRARAQCSGRRRREGVTGATLRSLSAVPRRCSRRRFTIRRPRWQMPRSGQSRRRLAGARRR